jgi:hypothetical protein
MPRRRDSRSSRGGRSTAVARRNLSELPGRSLMPLWMLIIFALCMLSAVLNFAVQLNSNIPMAMFAVTLVAFVVAVAIRGVRRPVV